MLFWFPMYIDAVWTAALAELRLQKIQKSGEPAVIIMR
jgi:hypothetical protein